MIDAFAACAPGLEGLLLQELGELGVAAPKAVAGGAEFRATWPDVYRVNLRCGLAACVLVRIARFSCLHLAELRRKAGNVEWPRWLDARTPVAVRARCRKSKLYHSAAVAQRVGEAITEHGMMLDAAAAAGESDGEAATERARASIGVHVRIDANECTLSLDTSGEPLWRRGWRLAVAKAPLRPDLACALLRASGWDRATPLVDPFCGSGTIAIEAAGLARNLAAGRQRRFAFEASPVCDGAAWDEVRSEAVAAALPSGPPIFGSDRDDGAVAAARGNAERAGVSVHWARAAFSAAPGLGAPPLPGPQGAVVTNPPHGRRIGDAKALRDLYASLGKLLAALPPAWRVGLAVSDRQLAGHTKRALALAFSAEHGGARLHALTT